MDEQFVRSKFSLLNGGLFNLYKRTVHSFRDDKNGKDENKKQMGIGASAEIKTNTSINEQIGAGKIQKNHYTYQRDIEPLKISPEEKKTDISKMKKEHKTEEQKIFENNFSNELMQSYYNNTCYSDINTNYLKDHNEVKRGEYLQHDEYINTYKNSTFGYNNDYNNTCGEYTNEYKKRNNNFKHYYNYDNIYKNKELLLYDETIENATDGYNFNKMKEDMRVYNELKKLKDDITLLHLMNANLQKQLINNQCSNTTTVQPHNIIINNKTEVASSTVNTIERQNDKKHKGIIYLLLKKILSSRLNQMLFISSIFVSFFLLNKQWQRAIKVAKLEKRVNSNILLKSVKLLEETMGIRKLNYI